MCLLPVLIIPKSKERCFMLYVCSTGLFKACAMKEAIDSFFRRAILANLENIRCIDFQFHFAKLSQ